MKSLLDRREFLVLASQSIHSVGLVLLFPAWSFAATMDPESNEAGNSPKFKIKEYFYPPVRDPVYPKREKVLARRKIHDVVNEAIDKLSADTKHPIPKEQIEKLKEETARAYENILKREFFLHDDP